jgi:hypothetical protein
MTDIGPIQRDVIAYLSRCGENGGHIGSTTKAKEFRGYDLNQVERALAGLIRRGIVQKRRLNFYVLSRKRDS